MSLSQKQRTGGQAESASWRVRPYEPGDDAAVVSLFIETFKKPLKESQYRWKVIETPWSVGAPGVWLAEAGGKIIGQYAGTPMRFKLGDEQALIVHACDVMTSVDFRRQGVLTALGTRANQAWAAAGVPFVTGLHFGGWGSRRHYLGWREQFKLVWMWRLLRPEPLLSLRLRLPFRTLWPAAASGRLWNLFWDRLLRAAERGVHVSTVDQPGPEYDALWDRIGSEYRALVVRDRAWVAYRYAQAPGFGYRLLLAQVDGQPAGYLAYRLTEHKGRKTGWIADLFTAPEDGPARAALLRRALADLLAAGAMTVRTLAAPGTATFRSFRRAGFLPASSGFDVSIVPLAPDLPRGLLSDPDRWFTMGGDYDVI